MSTTPTTVTVYTKADCRPCAATVRFLNERGVDFSTADITEPDNLEAAKALGYQEAPVVIVGFGTPGDEAHWSGFNPNELNKHFTKVSN